MAAKMSRGKNLELDKSVSMGWPQTEVAEHERQFREILEYCPAASQRRRRGGRLLFHNARLRKLMGYDEEEMHLFDTKSSGTTSIIAPASSTRCARGAASSSTRRRSGRRNRAGCSRADFLSRWHIAAGMSVSGRQARLWVYDVTALRQREAQIAEQERQFREILEYCPAGLNVVDEDGRLLFHNARLRELFGYDGRDGALRHAAVLARPRPARPHHRKLCARAAASS